MPRGLVGPRVRRASPGARALTMLGALCAVAALGAIGACSGSAAPRSEVVVMSQFMVRPDTLAVALGDTIVFRNEGLVPHTATADDGSWDSGAIAPGTSWKHVVRKTGTVAYHCSLHPNMRGVLQVK